MAVAKIAVAAVVVVVAVMEEVEEVPLDVDGDGKEALSPVVVAVVAAAFEDVDMPEDDEVESIEWSKEYEIEAVVVVGVVAAMMCSI